MATLIKTSCGRYSYVRPGASCEITGAFVDGAGEAIPLAQLDTLTLTLYDKETLEIINDREEVSVLNENDGIVDADGIFTITLGPLDNVIVTSGQIVGARERHVARLTWTWTDDGVERTGGEELEFEVQVWAEPTNG